MKNKKIKKAIWFYAVVLFTSAFILLLFTYFSQNKFDKNISNYINKLSEEEKKKIGFQTDLYSANEENGKLKKQIDSLNKEIDSLKSSNKTLESNETKLNDKYLKSKEAYEFLLKSEIEYSKGNVVESATILLKKCDSTLLDLNAAEKYNNLVNETYFEASRELYIQGLNNYKKKNYKESIENFKSSLDFDKESYLSDDCYYLMSYAFYRIDMIESAKETLETIINNYPDSNYKSDSLNLYKELQG